MSETYREELEIVGQQMGHLAVAVVDDIIQLEVTDMLWPTVVTIELSEAQATAMVEILTEAVAVLSQQSETGGDA